MRDGSLFAMMVIVVGMAMMNTGCMREYPVPKFEDVKPNETAFVIPLEGDTGKQDAFASAEFLLAKKVAAKRIEVPKRWVKTGRAIFGIWDVNGEWKDTIMVPRVDRTPVSKQFTPDEKTGTSKKNQGLYAESKDSIGVKSGWVITAYVAEEDTHIFLYRFKGDSLSDVMDNQLFNSVQAIYTEICNKYDLKQLRGQKQEITDAMREKIIPMYKAWGITVNPDMGLVGGFTYDDKEIQDAINKVFVAQTMKEANEAALAAQDALNKKDMSAKQNARDMVIVEKEGEAAGITKVAQAIAAAGPVYIQNKQLEVMAEGIKRWNGTPPQVMGGGGLPLMFNMPMPSAGSAASTTSTNAPAAK
jgi:hypothetical protein